MKKLLIIISLLVLSVVSYSQRVTDTNKLIVRDSAIFNNEALKITAATNGQTLQRIAGRWVNGNGQFIDTIQIIEDMLQISLYNDKKAMQSVGLASYIDDVGLTVFVNGEEKEVEIKQINFQADTSLNIENNGYHSYKFGVDLDYLQDTLQTGVDVWIDGDEKEVKIYQLNFVSDATTEITNSGVHAFKFKVADDGISYTQVATDLKGSTTDNDLAWDFSANGIVTATVSSSGSVSFSNLQVNKCLKAKLIISAGAVITWPASVKILNGSETLGDGTFYCYMDCWGSNEVLVSIVKEKP